MTPFDYPHIIRRPGDVARLERFPRTRVAQIAADHLGSGWSAEEIHRQHPHLTLGEIHAALGYYHDHRAEIDAELEGELALLQAAEKTAPSKLRLHPALQPVIGIIPPDAEAEGVYQFRLLKHSQLD